MKRRALVLVVALAAITSSASPGCTSGIGAAAPRAMNHPVDVAFACFDTSIAGLPVVRPLSECELRVDVSSNTRQPPANSAMHMHALVTQRTRGEVGAVDLIARGVLDSDVSVPGYTFVPVGELPTRIVVRPSDSNGLGHDQPACTYVASSGPVDGRHPGISIVDTRRFRSGAGLDHNPFPVFPPYVLPAAPSDMVLAPDEQSLWVTLDALGVLVRVPVVSSCELGEIDLVVPLYEEVPAGVPFQDGTTVDLTRQCGLPTGTSPVPAQVVAPRTPDVDFATDPEPVAITIDTERGWILVADRALPLIHVVDLATGTLLAPLAPGVPVRDVVVTPRVPDSYDLERDPLGGSCPTTGLHPAGGVVPSQAITFSRYVYAIDDTDGSVLAMEYSDPAAPGYGEVIPVDVRGARQPDRLAMPVVARTLTVITPQFDTTAADPRFGPAGPDPCTPPLAGNPAGYGLCIPTDAAPTQPPSPSVLRGVFLVIAAADGSVRIVDVYDLDAPCRGRAIGGVDPTTGTASAECTSPTITGDNDFYIRRHRPRNQLFLSQFVEIDSGPTVYFPGGGSVVLQNDGLPTGVTDDAGTTTPHLRALEDGGASVCPAGLGTVWPPPSDYPGAEPIVCSMVEPFAAIVETWSATFEGLIPGTYTSSANAQVDGSGVFNGILDTRIDYCAQGVIGRMDAVAIGQPEEPYAGDMIAITGALPDGALDQEICRRVVGISQVGEPQQPILARLDRAFTSPAGQQEPYLGRLVIDPTTTLENRSDGTTIADAIHCYGDRLLTVEVRSYGAFTVSGTRSGFMHRVGRDPADGHCQYDFSRDELRQGHAFNDVLFHNARIAFRPTNVPARLLTNELAEIRMVLNGNISQAGIDLSSSATGIRQPVLPSGLVYSPEMWALYAIESERRGLVEMTLRPLAVTQTAYQ